MELTSFTKKQMGDACEMIVAAELTLAGIPALKVPDNWPSYDVIAQPPGLPPQKLSVKSRSYAVGLRYVQYNTNDDFDWLAIVILHANEVRRRSIYLVPRAVADERARRNAPHTRTADTRYFRIDEIERLLGEYKNNFGLSGGFQTRIADTH